MAIRGLLLCMLSVCALCSMSCETLLGTLDGARIVSVTVTPDSISKNSTGMTDQFFTVVIETQGFVEPIAGATARIQQNSTPAVPQDAPLIEGDKVTLSSIAQSWFQGLEPGEYEISVRVFSEDDTESVEELNVATVTVTE